MTKTLQDTSQPAKHSDHNRSPSCSLGRFLFIYFFNYLYIYLFIYFLYCTWLICARDTHLLNFADACKFRLGCTFCRAEERLRGWTLRLYYRRRPATGAKLHLKAAITNKKPTATTKKVRSLPIKAFRRMAKKQGTSQRRPADAI